MKGEINNPTGRVGNFTSPFSIIDKTTRKKINKETEAFAHDYKPTRPSRHLQNTTPNKRVHIYLKGSKRFPEETI